MIVGNYELIIFGALEMENLSCEIYYKGESIADITQETGELLLSIYPSTSEKYWNVSLIEFQEILEIAKNHLLGSAL